MLLKTWKGCSVKISQNGRRLCAVGSLTPDVSTPIYKVKMVLTYRTFPSVHLLAHNFHRDSEGKLPPHLYRDLSLCLFYPEFNEWNHSMYLSNTILPWTLRWLFHYEIWKNTEEWIGGGTIHDKNYKVSGIEPPLTL